MVEFRFFSFVAGWLSFGVGPDCEQWSAFFVCGLICRIIMISQYFSSGSVIGWLVLTKCGLTLFFFSRLARFDPTRGFPISMLVRVFWKSSRYYDKLVYLIPVDGGTGNRIWISISKNLRCIVIAMIHNWHHWTDALVGILKGNTIIN